MGAKLRATKREELIRKALEVFYRNGFHATGMDMLVRETGVSKTSMYKHFRTKEDLILAALRLRDENIRNWMVRRVEELATAPQDRLIAVFDWLGEWFKSPEFQGCMFIKASAEYQDPTHPIHAQSAEHKRLIADYFEDLARNAGLANPARVAGQILLLKEGAIIATAMGLQRDAASDARAAAMTLLG